MAQLNESEERDTPSQSGKSQIDPNTTYQVAVSQIRLVSQEIYNRFSAMLTIHGFFLAAIGLFFNSDINRLLSHLIIMGVCAAGFLLCSSWRRFVTHGVQAQIFFRRKAAETEIRFGNSVDIFRELTKSNPVEESVHVRQGSAFEWTAKQVIRIFEILYGFLFLLSLLVSLSQLIKIAIGTFAKAGQVIL